MSGKLLFILNPRSGKGKIKNKLMEIIDIFVKDSWTVTVHTTQNAKDAFEMVHKNGSKYDRIVVSGGDGTLNEVIRGLMSLDEAKRPTVGYIPAGEFNNKNFVYVAAFGAFTNVSYETPQQNKNILGQSAYLLEGLKQLSSLKSYKLKVRYDDNEIEDEFILGMVANSNRIAGMKSRALKAQLNDGLFEVMLIKQPKTVFESNDIISKLAIGDLSGNSFFVFRTEKIEFISEESIPWTLDGEFGGSVCDAEISVKKEAVTLVF